MNAAGCRSRLTCLSRAFGVYFVEETRMGGIWLHVRSPISADRMICGRRETLGLRVITLAQLTDEMMDLLCHKCRRQLKREGLGELERSRPHPGRQLHFGWIRDG